MRLDNLLVFDNALNSSGIVCRLSIDFSKNWSSAIYQLGARPSILEQDFKRKPIKFD